MKKLSQAAAVLSLGIACALPAMAQDTSSTTPSGNTTASSTQMNNATPSTSQMGAGPSDMDRPVQHDNDRDIGWIGLLGLAGLLGLRRRHHDHTDRHEYRANTNAR